MKSKKKSYKKSYKKKIKKPIYKSNNFWTAIVLFLFFSLIGYYLVFFEFLWVKDIQVLNNNRVSDQEIKDFVEKEITNNLIFTESKSIFLFESNSLANKLIDNFPLLLAVKINKKYPDKLIIEVFERRTIGTMCSEKCFLLDSFGVIFQETDTRKHLNIVKDNDQEYFIGQEIVSPEDINSIINIWNEIIKDIKIHNIYINESDLTLITRDNYSILFNLNQDINLQIAKLKITLEEKIPQNERKNIEYIDLRFERVYFKYKD